MSIIIAMCTYALTMSISPGPVNVITLTSGVNYGFMRTLPFVAGAAIGFTLLLSLIGLGLGEVATNSAIFMSVLSFGGTAFICYMGYKIATSRAEINFDGREEDQTAPGFFKGALMQWLNPKAWIASVVGIGAFNLFGVYGELAVFASLYLCVCFFSVAVWAFAGAKISILLKDPDTLKIFNIIMGTLLVLVAFYLLYMQLSA